MIQSNEKLFRITELLLEKGEAGVTEIADETSFHKSTVHVHLQTMRERGFVVKSGSTYRLSFKFLTIGERIKEQQPVYRSGHNEIDSLATETGELAYLAVPENESMVIIHYAQGDKATQRVTVGSKFPIDGNSVGKVLLAFRSDGAPGDDAEPNRDSSRDAPGGRNQDLPADLQQVRTDGFAILEDQNEDGLPYIAAPDYGAPRSESHRTEIEYRTVTAPILDRDEPVAAVAITGPAKRIDDDYQEQIREHVVRTAAVIERKLEIERTATYADDAATRE